ncbi:unnamed protein product [Protopolystoma xenopodis]|uniref:Uncharacterized protein n=1 Tax=Protopolystoma xenopodis TaxID=117903 RepID=A0A448X8R0_9PLAT|nr:unnamed protein product [Protopolystoma xenopodis]
MRTTYNERSRTSPANRSDCCGRASGHAGRDKKAQPRRVQEAAVVRARGKLLCQLPWHHLARRLDSCVISSPSSDDLHPRLWLPGGQRCDAFWPVSRSTSLGVCVRLPTPEACPVVTSRRCPADGVLSKVCLEGESDGDDVGLCAASVEIPETG